MSNKFTSKQKLDRARVRFWWIAWVFLFGSILVTGLLVVEQSNQRRALYQYMLDLRVQQDDTLSELARLQVELGSEASYERVVDVANSDLAMEFPKVIIPTKPEIVE
ncbi:MAG: cell division protein FtsL [Gammaproteobacteria bacterium]|nr:cell division protein FtsL [Gammaproteobacteria bacterium]MDE0252364.1 cell division protein FtsL [Gammaproteobacteria bacterium]MDE0402527.1 cell division protein FtsL [Gammaproteobacteria bacterium]